MAEDLLIVGESREEKYQYLYPQIEALLANEKHPIAALGNFCACIQMTFNFLWTGFYVVENNELILHVFQGPLACTKIKMGSGVCGKAAQLKQTIVVPNVHEFPGHIACSSLSNSEIVLPLLKNDQVVAVLDLDSIYFNDFTEIDAFWLDKLIALVIKYF